jgi:hypothetical protein
MKVNLHIYKNDKIITVKKSIDSKEASKLAKEYQSKGIPAFIFVQDDDEN